jgi:phage-related protein (TIGR01555 family)
MSKVKEKKSLDVRLDSMRHSGTGMGTSRDKLTGMSPDVKRVDDSTAEDWYMSSGFFQRVVDAPAYDMTRNWIKVKVNGVDHEQSENISRKIMNRMTELKLRERIYELIRFSRMYNRGGCLYYVITAELPQTTWKLSEPLPFESLKKINAINVLPPRDFQVIPVAQNPLSSLYHSYDYRIGGISVHESRVAWLVNSYFKNRNRGVSAIETTYDAIIAQETALWSVRTLLFELSGKVFKKKGIDSFNPEKMSEFMYKITSLFNTQGAIALDMDESLDRLNSAAGFTGLKDMMEFIWQFLCAVSSIPRTRMMGQTSGIVRADQDIIGYYDWIASQQELQLKPIIENDVKMIIHEQDGEVYKELNGHPENLDWEIIFNPLYLPDPQDAAKIRLIDAQTDQIYITTAVHSPSEIRAKRQPELEPFGADEGQPLDLKEPPVPEMNFNDKQPGDLTNPENRDANVKPEKET